LVLNFRAGPDKRRWRSLLLQSCRITEAQAAPTNQSFKDVVTGQIPKSIPDVEMGGTGKRPAGEQVSKVEDSVRRDVEMGGTGKRPAGEQVSEAEEDVEMGGTEKRPAGEQVEG
jgi:hypothetical protein